MIDPFLALSIGALAIGLLKSKPTVNVRVDSGVASGTDGPTLSDVALLDTPHAELIDSMNPRPTAQPGVAPALVPYAGATSPSAVPVLSPATPRARIAVPAVVSSTNGARVRRAAY